MVVVGIDLSGPTNIKDTVYAAFALAAGRLTHLHTLFAATDEMIWQQTADFAKESPVVVGLDAPLSYNPGGGDRPSDKQLRQRIISLGLHSGSIMTPTMTRMAYLTLRGITVARLLQTISPVPQIVEVHPGAALALHGAPIPTIRAFKQNATAQQQLLDWLATQGLTDLASVNSFGDHSVAAYASAFAAWKWVSQEAKWIAPAMPPFHPFAFAC
jgi:predicted nuclease with RNAse H fold